MKCMGFGEYKGKCENEAGTPWTPHWCMRCDELRREHITKQIDKMLAEMKVKKSLQ